MEPRQLKPDDLTSVDLQLGNLGPKDLRAEDLKLEDLRPKKLGPEDLHYLGLTFDRKGVSSEGRWKLQRCNDASPSESGYREKWYRLRSSETL